MIINGKFSTSGWLRNINVTPGFKLKDLRILVLACNVMVHSLLQDYARNYISLQTDQKTEYMNDFFFFC